MEFVGLFSGTIYSNKPSTSSKTELAEDTAPNGSQKARGADVMTLNVDDAVDSLIYELHAPADIKKDIKDYYGIELLELRRGTASRWDNSRQ